MINTFIIFITPLPLISMLSCQDLPFYQFKEKDPYERSDVDLQYPAEEGKNNNNNNRHQTSHSTYPPSPLGILPSIMAYFSMLVIMSIMVVILFASYSWKGNIH